MKTGRQHIESMFIQCLEIEGNESLQFAYDYYMDFYTLSMTDIANINKELIRANLVHSIIPYKNMKHKMKVMSVSNALIYLERFK